ncbi:MAG TPA: hypothetical protein VFJ85_09240 [Acidimicrobiales bacterium]|nr:hypothetical protein [Acidimicrobiales bacterium]
MPNPQQPEIARSRKTTAQDPDAASSIIEGRQPLPDDGDLGPVPPDNRAGHHPATEQDKPDLDDFAKRLGVAEPEPAIASLRTTPDRRPRLRALAAVLGAAAVVFAGRFVRRRRRAATVRRRPKTPRALAGSALRASAAVVGRR